MQSTTLESVGKEKDEPISEGFMWTNILGFTSVPCSQKTKVIRSRNVLLGLQVKPLLSFSSVTWSAVQAREERRWSLRSFSTHTCKLQENPEPTGGPFFTWCLKQKPTSSGGAYFCVTERIIEREGESACKWFPGSPIYSFSIFDTVKKENKG